MTKNKSNQIIYSYNLIITWWLLSLFKQRKFPLQTNMVRHDEKSNRAIAIDHVTLNMNNIFFFYSCLKTYISILYCCNCRYNYECIFVIAPWGTLIGIKKKNIVHVQCDVVNCYRIISTVTTIQNGDICF
jgi:hypothetical protein